MFEQLHSKLCSLKVRNDFFVRYTLQILCCKVWRYLFVIINFITKGGKFHTLGQGLREEVETLSRSGHKWESYNVDQLV